MKILYVTTIAATMDFFPEHFRMLIEEGHTVELACNNGRPVSQQVTELGFRVHNIPFSRSPFSRKNIKALKQLKELIEQGNYDIVHTHTPNASVCVRVACRRMRKKGLKVFYTAHGFHFYKGAPLKNWLIYYPVEWLCAHWTDKLITINQEDYALAQKRMHAKEVVYVPGVGIDLAKFGGVVVDRATKRKSISIPDGEVWILAVGELITRKNHETLIRAIADIPDVYLTIAGQGELEEYLQGVIKELGLIERVKLLGFRTDISELCEAADVFCLPSFHEGLPVALMEAMACGKPCVVSDIRGNTDLIKEEGALFDPHSIDSIKKAIEWVLQSDMEQIGRSNAEMVRNFAIETVIDDMQVIYDENISGGGYTLIEKMYKRALIRRELDIPNKATILISVGELNDNKNHETAIRAVEGMDVYYIIAGVGDKKEYLQNLIDKQGMTERIKLLGFRTDVKNLYTASDVFVFPSFREGLSVSLMEAMASGLPCVVSRIRGNVDLIDNPKVTFAPNDLNEMTEYLKYILGIDILGNKPKSKTQKCNKCDMYQIGKKNSVAVQKFSTEVVLKQMKEIYGCKK